MPGRAYWPDSSVEAVNALSWSNTASALQDSLSGLKQQVDQLTTATLPSLPNLPSLDDLTQRWLPSSDQAVQPQPEQPAGGSFATVPDTAPGPLQRALKPLQDLTAGWGASATPAAGDVVQTRQPASSGAATAQSAAMPTAQSDSAQPAAPVTLPDHLDTSSREANLRQWAPALQDVERRTGLRADAMAAIIQAENGGGQSPLSANDQNYFSITAVPGRPYQAGVGTGGRFAHYNSPQDSLNDFVDLIQKHYPEAWANRGDPQKFFAGLVKGGYIVPEPGFPVETWLTNLENGRQHFNQLAPAAPPPPANIPGPDLSPNGTPITAPAAKRGPYSGTYTQQSLANAGDPDAWAKCGPVAALQASALLGGNLDPATVERLAKQRGWTASAGMAGLQSEAGLLNDMNIAAKAEQGPVDWQRVIADVQRGNPVILQLPGHEGHYVTAQAYDPQTGRIDFGSTVGDLRAAGHKTQFTPQELEGLGWGSPNGALYLDNPATPAPSVVAGNSGASSITPPRPDASDAAASVTAPTAASMTDRMATTLGQPTMYRQPLGMQATTDTGQASDREPRDPPPPWPPVSTPGQPYDTGDVMHPAPSYPMDTRPPGAQPGDVTDEEGVDRSLDPLLPPWQDHPPFVTNPYAVPPGTMYRQPLQQFTPSAVEGPGADTTPTEDASFAPGASVPPWEQNPLAAPGAGAPPVRDDYATAGGSVPAIAPAAQVIPQEDPTAIPRPAYAPPAEPIMATPPPAETETTPPPSPYDQQQAASMEPAPDRFSTPSESPLKPVWDAGGTVIGYVHAGLDAVDRSINAPVAPPGSPQARALQTVGINPDALPAGGPFGAAERTVRDLPANLASLPAANQQAVKETADAIVQSARATGQDIQQGNVLAAVGDGLMTGLNAANALYAPLARDVDHLLPDFGVGPLGAGDIALNTSVPHDVVNLATSAGQLVANGVKATPKVLDALRSGMPVESILQRAAGAIDTGIGAARAGAERAATVEAEQAGPGATAYGTLGAGPPSSAGLGARVVSDLGNAVGGGVAGATYAAATGDSEDPGALARDVAIGAVAGPVAGRLIGRSEGALATLGAGPRRFTDPAEALAASHGAIGEPNPTSPNAGTSRLEVVRRWIVRQATDNTVDLAELQKDAQRVLGRPLTAEEMITEQTRANPAGASKVMIDDRIKPVLQGLDESRPVVTLPTGQALTQRSALTQAMVLANNRDVAVALNTPTRVFSGGLTGSDSEAALQHLISNMAPEDQRAVAGGMRELNGVVETYRQKLVDAGVWSQDFADEMRQRYPNWVPTKILDYMADADKGGGVGTRSISMRDRGVRQYTLEGTLKSREDPIASLIRYVDESEARIQKNEVFQGFANLYDALKANPESGWANLVKEVPNSATAAAGRGERTVQGFINGERRTFITSPAVSAAVRMEQGTQIPILRDVTRLFRELITRTPVFVAGQIPLDAMAAIVRTSNLEGGPQYAPKVAAEIVKGYATAFSGLLSNEFKGDAARYMREGGAMAGFYQRGIDAASHTVDSLTRRSMFEIKDAGDAANLAKWLAGGGWVQAVGQRVELGPRIAAFRMGEQRALRAGADPETAALQGVMAGRNSTMDFQVGGAAAKVINQAVPFFNVGVQSSVTLARIARENPKAFPFTMAALVAAPTVAAEAWNRSDLQRAQDYADVPDYIKDRGIVFMLPGVTGKDEQGNPKPNFAIIPLRELAPVAILTRELAASAMRSAGMEGQDSPRGWGALLGAAASSASPVQANSAADLFSSMNPVGINTGLQLATNRDYFRNRDIATERNDQQASALARGAASAINAVTGSQIRPSQTDFAIRDLTGSAGAAASAASDLVAGRTKDEQRIQSAPVVGGIVRRFVGDTTGGQLEKARDTRISERTRGIVNETGLRDDQLTPVGTTIENVPLLQREQTAYQARTNRYFEQEIVKARGAAAWRTNPQDRQQMVRDALSTAKERAAADVMQAIPPAERQRRVGQAARQKAS